MPKVKFEHRSVRGDSGMSAPEYHLQGRLIAPLQLCSGRRSLWPRSLDHSSPGYALRRADAYDAALLDVAQDHLLYLLAAAGAFDDGQLAFKGGTSYRRVALGRDLYDLHHFAQHTIDEELVRRLWVLKVWSDVVDDRRGNKPADRHDVLHQRQERDFQPDSIGTLTPRSC